MRRGLWRVFVVVQAIGEVCQWSWPSVYSAIGPWLWAGAFFLLFPGNLTGGYLIEKFLWRSGLTLFEMQLIQVPFAIAINLAVWAVGAWAGRHLGLKLGRTTGGPMGH
jgi:hypothetical protein